MSQKIMRVQGGWGGTIYIRMTSRVHNDNRRSNVPILIVILFFSAAMAMGSDVRDILEIETDEKDDFMTKEALFSDAKKVFAKLKLIYSKTAVFVLFNLTFER